MLFAKKSLILVLSIIVLITVLFATNVAADNADSDIETNDANNAVENVETNNSSENDPWYKTLPLIGSLIASVEDLTNSFSNIINFLQDVYRYGLAYVLELTLGVILQAFYELVAEGIRTGLFLTPLVKAAWMWNIWWPVLILSSLLAILGIALTMYKTYVGKSKTQWQTLLIFLLVLFLNYLSVYISNGIIVFANDISDTFAKKTLVEVYNQTPDKSGLLSNLNSSEIKGFSSFDGESLCRIAFSGDLNAGKKFYQIFSTANENKPGGGVIIMTWGMLVMILAGLFGIVRQFVLHLLVAIAPFYITFSVFQNSYDPFYGWIALFARTVLIAWIFDIAWLFSAYANLNSGDFLFAGQVIACILFTVALVVATMFWVKKATKAAKMPFTLNGKEEKERISSSMAKLGQKIAAVGDYIPGRLGDSIVEFGGEMKASFEERERIAKEKAEGTYDPTKMRKKDRIREAKRKYREEFYTSMASRLDEKGAFTETANVSRKAKLVQFDMRGFSLERLEDVLSRELPYDTLIDEDGTYIDTRALDKAKEAVREEIRRNTREIARGGKTMYLFDGFDEEETNQIKEFFNENELSYQDANAITIDARQWPVKLEEIKQTLDILESVSGENLREYEKEGARYYEIFLAGNAKDKIVKMLEANNIAYNESKGKIHVRQDAFDFATLRWNNINEILVNSNQTENGLYRITAIGEAEYNALKEKLEQARIVCDTKETLVTDKENLDEYLERGIDLYSKVKADEGYKRIVVRNKEEAEEIKAILKGIFPAEVIREGEYPNVFYVDGTEAEEIEELMRQYSDLPVYWTDGKYYYYRKKQDKVVKKHALPPPKAQAVQDGGEWVITGYRKIGR